MVDEREWTVELSAETIRLVRRELEWALQHQRDRVVRRLPQNKLALRTRQRGAFAISLFLLGCGAWLCATDPGPPSPLAILGLAAGAIALIAAPFMPRYFAWTYRAIGRRLARRAEALVRPLEDVAPAAIRYRWHDDQLDARVGERELALFALDDVRLVVATATAVFVFRHAIAAEPIAIVCGGAELADAMARAGVAIERVAGPVARYGEWTALPTATVRRRLQSTR